MNTELVSSSSPSLMTSSSVSRPALSWCSKCGQSMEMSSESILLKSKTNFKFRKIFDFDNSEVLIKTFSCALVDDILFQGTLYTSQNHFCFFSRIANKHKKIIIAISQIVQISKEKTAGIFPNAIAIRTQHNRHLFASFVYRQVAFRCLNEVWAAHQTERFKVNWSLAFTDDTYPKENPLLVDIEADSLVVPTVIKTNKELLDNLKHDRFILDMKDSSDDKSIRSKSKIRTMYKSKESLRKLSTKSFVAQNSSGCSTEPTLPFLRLPIGNSFDFITKNHAAMIVATIVIVFLILYIIVLAWKIHNLQLTFLEQVLSPNSAMNMDKSLSDEIICPANEDNGRVYMESVVSHQSRMTNVQSNLKETLHVLQTIVKLSEKMFNRIQQASPSSIINAPTSPDET